MKVLTLLLFACLAAGAAHAGQAPAGGGSGNQEPGPSVTVRGHTFTQESLFRRNVGGPDDMTTPFPPHKVIGNIYYVGTRSLAVVSHRHAAGQHPHQQHLRAQRAADSEVDRAAGIQVLRHKILLGSHAHGDHQEGDAMVKELTGAQVMALDEDVPALRAMRPGGKPHPIDKVLHDGDKVTLGGTTLVARLTPGHSRGCTTWTLKAQEGGKSYDVVIIGSFGTNPGFKLVNNIEVPGIVEEFNRTFKVARSLPCDVPLDRTRGCTTWKRSTRSSGAAARTPSSIPPATSSKWTSMRPCSARSSRNNKRLPPRAADCTLYNSSNRLYWHRSWTCSEQDATSTGAAARAVGRGTAQGARPAAPTRCCPSPPPSDIGTIASSPGSCSKRGCRYKSSCAAPRIAFATNITIPARSR